MTFEDIPPQWQDPNAAEPPRRNTRAVLGGTAAVLLIAVAGTLGGTLALTGNSEQGNDDIVLQSLDSVGPGPFTASVALNSVGVSDSVAGQQVAADRDSARGVRTVNGTAPALYGGTNDNASCDAAALANFLGQDEGKSAAWASAFGITTESIPYYLDTLTPVVLTRDTWVTNHSFVDGVATPYQSVLQAGTAVLVDAAGVPRVRCACGNPLGPPATEPLSTYTPAGDSWPKYRTSMVTAVDYSTPVPAGQPVSTAANNAAVEKFTLADLAGAGTLVRAAGGTVDVSPLPVLRTPLPDPVAMNLPLRAVSAPANRDIAPRSSAPAARPATSDFPAVTTPTAPTTALPRATVPVVSTPVTTTSDVAPTKTRATTTSATTTSTTTTSATTTSAITTSATTSAVEAPTTFTGDTAGRVRSFVPATGIECTAKDADPAAADVTVECVELRTATATQHRIATADLNATAVESATVNGVWRVKFLDESAPIAVVSAVRALS